VDAAAAGWDSGFGLLARIASISNSKDGWSRLSLIVAAVAVVAVVAGDEYFGLFYLAFW